VDSPPPDPAVLALLVEEFFMSEGQALLRTDAPGARVPEGASIPPAALERRLGPAAARAFLERQRSLAERFDALGGRVREWRDRLEAAAPEALPALHAALAADPAFRAVARDAVACFFLYYPDYDRYIATVHPGAAQHPGKFPREAEETRAHYRGMEQARTWLELS
jgi:hypothetical protein